MGLLFGAVMVTGLAADVITKSIVVARLDPELPIRLLGGLLTLRLLRNPGAAFSQGQQFTYVFAAAAILVLTFVIVRLVPRVRHVGWAIALGLLCAGVAGNLVDRLFRRPAVLRGHVVDFLQLPYFAIFNVADMCITASAVLIIYWSVIKGVGLNGERAPRPPAKSRAQGGS
ncbi:MAG TPA: signal peptidase II [Propionibacteriaceae bacterium]|nr:signal peptidase II [Propionibacteriaceae bacterium]